MMVEIDNLTLKLDGRFIFRNFSLSLERGDRVLVRGSIGSGKTTLFNIIIGFEKNFRGSVRIAGKKPGRKAVGNHISFIAQNPDYQLLTSTVEDEIEFISGKKPMENIIKYFQLENLLKRHPLTLSSSEKRRVLFAGVISSPSDLMVLDEPTADLDNLWRDRVVELLRETDKTVLMFSHEDFEFMRTVRLEKIIQK